jgi:signal transduction histidine kinase
MFTRSDIKHLPPDDAEVSHFAVNGGCNSQSKAEAAHIASFKAVLFQPRERDRAFRDYLTRQSFSGLQTLGIVEISVPILMQAVFLAMNAGRYGIGRLPEVAAGVIVGLLTIIVSRFSWSVHHARMAAMSSAWLACAGVMAAALWRPTQAFGADDYVPAAVALVLITAVAIVPLRPLQALALGLAVDGSYLFSYWVDGRWEVSSIRLQGEAHHIFLLLLALLAAGISATNYQHRRAEFQSQQQAVRAAEALSGAQLRAQLSENAASIGKMAAALSHEMNSPLGTLRSSVETLLALTSREIHAPPEERERLSAVRTDLERLIRESASRIEDVTSRLRRFTGLEDADLKFADLNDLISTAAVALQDRIDATHARLEFDLQKTIQPLNCRPQLLSAAFSALLSNALNAVNGDGEIRVSTRQADSEVEVTVSDNGRGMTAEEVETMFDPSLKIEGGRVASGNWSLFNTRQIIYEHGGEILVETQPGKGTAVHVVLPAGA